MGVSQANSTAVCGTAMGVRVPAGGCGADLVSLPAGPASPFAPLRPSSQITPACCST